MVNGQNILLTTSRRPTKSMRTLCRDLSHTLPNIIRINRGKLSLEGLAETALNFNASKVAVVDRWKGGPGKIEFFIVKHGVLERIPPLVYVRGVKFRRDFGENMPKGRRIKSLAISASSKENFEIKRFEGFLSEFLQIPISSIENAVGERRDAIMQVLMDHTNHLVVTFRLVPEMVEVGPKITISHLIWE
ncbi:MAG: hypothetical protein QXG27_00685 [Candidatus Bathyarchaeia archaeon]